MEHQGFPALLHLPRLGQGGDEVEVGIDAHEAVEEVSDDILRLNARGGMRVEAGDIRLPGHPQYASSPGLLGPARWLRQEQTSNEHAHEPDAAPVPDHRRTSSADSPLKLTQGRRRCSVCAAARDAARTLGIWLPAG